MSVDPVDGSVNVVFYDRRDTTGAMTKVVMARSIDGGKTFVNHKVDQPAFKCDNNTFFGDYTGISAFGGRVIPMFMNFDEQKKLVVDYVHVERSEIEETGEYDLQGLFIRLGHAIDTVGAKRVVLDSLEVLFTGLPDEAIARRLCLALARVAPQPRARR